MCVCVSLFVCCCFMCESLCVVVVCLLLLLFVSCCCLSSAFVQACSWVCVSYCFTLKVSWGLFKTMASLQAAASVDDS